MWVWSVFGQRQIVLNSMRTVHTKALLRAECHQDYLSRPSQFSDISDNILHFRDIHPGTGTSTWRFCIARAARFAPHIPRRILPLNENTKEDPSPSQKQVRDFHLQNVHLLTHVKNHPDQKASRDKGPAAGSSALSSDP